MASHSLTVLGAVRPPVPPALVAKFEAWGPADRPAVPRRSASVVLIRSGPAAAGSEGAAGRGLQVYLLQRHARMAFAASMAVFPGGGLEPVDDGPDPLRACAVRETQEETGVELAAGDLHPWAHWITPEVEPRRYDTIFYLGVLPSGQEARDISGETDTAGWWSPTEALAAAERGELGLMPPTLSILTELASAGDVRTLLAQAVDRVVETVLPELRRGSDGWRFVYPAVDR